MGAMCGVIVDCVVDDERDDDDDDDDDDEEEDPLKIDFLAVFFF